jgi:hypothetical protein
VADDDGGVGLQRRGREEEVRCTANRIHGAWRSGSSRRGGFSSGNFKNGDDGGFLTVVLGQEEKGKKRCGEEN